MAITPQAMETCILQDPEGKAIANCPDIVFINFNNTEKLGQEPAGLCTRLDSEDRVQGDLDR